MALIRRTWLWYRHPAASRSRSIASSYILQPYLFYLRTLIRTDRSACNEQHYFAPAPLPATTLPNTAPALTRHAARTRYSTQKASMWRFDNDALLNRSAFIFSGAVRLHHKPSEMNNRGARLCADGMVSCAPSITTNNSWFCFRSFAVYRYLLPAKKHDMPVAVGQHIALARNASTL